MHPWMYPWLVPPDAADGQEWEIAWSEPTVIPFPLTRAGSAVLAMRAWRLRAQAARIARRAARGR